MTDKLQRFTGSVLPFQRQKVVHSDQGAMQKVETRSREYNRFLCLWYLLHVANQ